MATRQVNALVHYTGLDHWFHVYTPCAGWVCHDLHWFAVSPDPQGLSAARRCTSIRLINVHFLLGPLWALVLVIVSIGGSERHPPRV